MAHPPSSPSALHPAGMHPSSSPPPPEAGSVLHSHSTSPTPTPESDHGVFQEYGTLLKNATTLVTFGWDPENSRGELTPIP
jgi:hypothetical protein